MSITYEEAKKSADEWYGEHKSPMRTWFLNAILNPEKHRDIGKVLAYCAEEYVIQWLREHSYRPIDTVVGEAYDAITIDDDKLVRIQIKFRMDEWTLSTTRKSSAYKSDEFDLLVIFKPSPTFGITGSTIRCIPISALINPSKPDQLITKINSSLKKIYDSDEKSIEVLNKVFHPS